MLSDVLRRGIKIPDVSIFTLPIPVMGRWRFILDFYFGIIPYCPPQIKKKIYFNFVVFFLAFCFRMCYIINMVVGQTAAGFAIFFYLKRRNND